jgi:hypothetical protein
MDHLFTHAEAERLLPLLTDLLTRLRDEVAEVEETRAQLAALPERQRHNGRAPEAARLEQRVAELVGSINALIERIQGFGVEIKDVGTGLVDFRAMRDGRVVYLCWRLGEPHIAFWHELDAGFAGRQPLD